MTTDHLASIVVALDSLKARVDEMAYRERNNLVSHRLSHVSTNLRFAIAEAQLAMRSAQHAHEALPRSNW